MRGHPDRSACLAIVALAAAVFGRGLWPGKVLSPADAAIAIFPWSAVAPGLTPANPLPWDIAFMFHPWLVHAAREIAAGHFPLWNPHVFTGAPFFANPQTALLFPLTALAYVMPAATAIALAAILKTATAGLGTYWFLRQLAVTPWPALVAASGFMLSGVMAVWLHWTYANAIALAPVLLAVTERLRRRADATSVAWLAVCVVLLAFAGYPQGAALATLLAGTWALVRARAAPQPRRFVLAWAAGVALGVAAAAVQILPFLEYLSASAVAAYRQEYMWRLFLPPRAAIALLMPFYYGSPMGDDFWGPANFNELTTSVGLVPLVALPLALALAWRRAGVRFFFAAAALAAVIVFGVPGAGPLLAEVPPLSMAIPTRMASVLALALAVLAGLGLQAVLEVEPATLARARRVARATFAGLVVVAFVFVAGDFTTHARLAAQVPVGAQYLALVALLAVATVLVLGLMGHRSGTYRWLGLLGVQLAATLPLAVTYNGVIDARLFYPEPPPLVRHLQDAAQHERSRVLFRVFRAANLGVMFGLDEAGGYDGITPRRIDDLVDPEGSLDSLASGVLRVTAPLDSPALNLVGIRHVAVPANGKDAPPPWPLEWEGDGGRVYRNPRAARRVSLIYRAATCLDEPTTLARLADAGFDPRREAIIAGCDGVPAVGPAGSVARADLQEYSAQRVTIRAETDAPGWLVLTDAWFPGWRARVNGAEQPIWRANYAFRAVWLPAGRHEVEFRYWPRPLTWGLAASGAASLAIAALFWRGRRRA